MTAYKFEDFFDAVGPEALYNTIGANHPYANSEDDVVELRFFVAIDKAERTHESNISNT